ncbi:uncharacterized protein LOC128290346 isoform X1 [Gossypium arboreum]|uniref:uncharacterized protein LOC128290346 isoform X1 n=1 Tax=Gossypium arboreum TaxID=29729 RepID=UPI0022F1ACF2|nr:uncharacterized protein LOC128290346 isoform X1 [Gossypium arboreum]XP_052881684.1 uncharacterized protein LOC128290346 isoform X1 [Gossypium arboreum]XP_052881685.1 uncharacterized protein LOC128290346 isoform X1 [Gossypium arboreum]
MDGYVITQTLLDLVFWSMSGSLGTRFEAKLYTCLGKHGYQLRQPGLSFCWMHGPGLAEFMHSDDLFELIVDLKSSRTREDWKIVGAPITLSTCLPWYIETFIFL